jgi:thymidine kinase
MYSGKTERLLEAVRTLGRENVVLIKPVVDTRHSSALLVSHGGRFAAARPVVGLEAIPQLVGRTEVIGIDELQFFEEGIIEVLEDLRDRGRTVVAAGLDLDFLRRPFGVVPQVAEMADSVTRLRATCHRCGGPADFTQRLVGGAPAAPDDEVIKVGGAALYEARCGSCYEDARAPVLR